MTQSPSFARKISESTYPPVKRVPGSRTKVVAVASVDVALTNDSGNPALPVA